MSIKFKYLIAQLLQGGYSTLHHSNKVKLWFLLLGPLKEQRTSTQITLRQDPTCYDQDEIRLKHIRERDKLHKESRAEL